MLSEPICLRVKGPFACFTRPEFHVERVSYPVITPSAARGILEAILMKPVEKPEAGKRSNKVGFRWHILRLGIIHKGHLMPILRNELGYPAHPAYGNSSGYDCAEARQQRHSLILAGDTNAVGQRAPLEYLVEACIEVQGDLGPRGERGKTPRLNAIQTLAKYHQMFLRRASSGQCFYQPFFGCREFSVAEWQLERAGFDAVLPPNLSDDQFGPVFRDFDFGAFWSEWHDPDTGNMPRVQPDSLKGLVTDVCLKRKVRNFFTLYNPNSASPSLWANSENRNGYNIFIRENAVFQELMEAEDIAADAEKMFNTYPEPNKGKWKRPAKGKSADNEFISRAFRDALCSRYLDLRAFGGVISTEGPLKGSFYGQVRGPLQITFAESLDKVLPLDATITRCAVASVKEQQQAASSEEEATNRTMGRKHGIDYGLYRCHIHFSPAFAAKTGFSYYDLDNFLFALQHMFDDDHAAGRHLRLVGLVDFQHVSSLGNAPAHKLFDLVKVDSVTKDKDGKKVFSSSDSEFPRSLADYSGAAPDGDLHVKDGKVLSGKNGEGVAVVQARQPVWEIPSGKTGT